MQDCNAYFNFQNAYADGILVTGTLASTWLCHQLPLLMYSQLHSYHLLELCLLLKVSGEAILKALQAAMESAPSALAARSVLVGFDSAIK